MPETSPSSDAERHNPLPDVAAGASSTAPSTAGPGGSAVPAPAAGTESAMARSRAQARRLALVAWEFIGGGARYYWGMRELLWEYIAGFAPNLMSESVRMREVRLAPYESHALAEYDSTGWKASVPGRCVVCGEPTANAPADDDLSIDDASRAFWLPVATWICGAALGIALWNRWYLILALPLGPALGYALRDKVAVRLRLARCDEHATRTNIPQVLAWGNTLVLRFGHKLVRKVFLYGEQMGTTVPQPEASVISPVVAGNAGPAALMPETIPLAESPPAEDATIRHDRPAVFESEDGTSPMVP